MGATISEKKEIATVDISADVTNGASVFTERKYTYPLADRFENPIALYDSCRILEVPPNSPDNVAKHILEGGNTYAMA